MPLYIEPIPMDPSVYSYKSVLFVVCEVCPKMCMSVEQSTPYWSIGGLFGKRDFFAEYIAGLRKMLEDKGVHTGVFRNRKINAMMCLWPHKERNALAGYSANFDAIGVIGCSSAVFTVNDAVKSREVRVFPLMRVLGIANFKSKMGSRISITLDKPESDYIVKEPGLFD